MSTRVRWQYRRPRPWFADKNNDLTTTNEWNISGKLQGAAKKLQQPSGAQNPRTTTWTSVGSNLPISAYPMGHSKALYQEGSYWLLLPSVEIRRAKRPQQPSLPPATTIAFSTEEHCSLCYCLHNNWVQTPMQGNKWHRKSRKHDSSKGTETVPRNWLPKKQRPMK